MSNPITPTNADLTGDVEEILIEQNHTRGPGWFLKISYVCIVAFMIYYCFAHWNWKSDYQKHMETEQVEVDQASR